MVDKEITLTTGYKEIIIDDYDIYELETEIKILRSMNRNNDSELMEKKKNVEGQEIKIINFENREENIFKYLIDALKINYLRIKNLDDLKGITSHASDLIDTIITYISYLKKTKSQSLAKYIILMVHCLIDAMSYGQSIPQDKTLNGLIDYLPSISKPASQKNLLVINL